MSRKRKKVRSGLIPIMLTKKVGRNEPCVCGSGKKFKQCCLTKGDQNAKRN